jgi:hypothetical protein
MKNRVHIFTKSGVTMHCSICGKADHNKKGHAKWVESQLEEMQQNVSRKMRKKILLILFRYITNFACLQNKITAMTNLIVFGCSMFSHTLQILHWIQHTKWTIWYTEWLKRFVDYH